MESVAWAESTAADLLAGEPDRWAHTGAVVDAACRVAGRLPADDGLRLRAAAYLHDVGYAAGLIDTGLHHLDGALWVRAHGGNELASLVAHHTSADDEATLRGLDTELAGFPMVRDIVHAALTYCDVISGPSGERMSLDQRIAEVADRYGEDDVVVRGLRLAKPRLAVQVAQIERLLAQSMTGSGPLVR